MIIPPKNKFFFHYNVSSQKILYFCKELLYNEKRKKNKRGETKMNHLENKGPEYDFYGKLSLKKAIPLGLQHVLAMFVGNLTGPIANS